MFISGQKIQVGLRPLLLLLLLVSYSAIRSQNVLSVTDKKGRTFILTEHSRVKFKLRRHNHMYKGTVYGISDTALNVNGNPVRIKDIDMIAFSALRRGTTIATLAVLGADGLAIAGALAGGAAATVSIVYIGLVAVYATPILIGYTIYHSIHKRKFYLDELWMWEVYPAELKKIKRKERQAKEFDGHHTKRVENDYFSN